MTRLSIEISGPSTDDQMAQAKVLIGCEPELTALVTKLGELGCRVTHRARFVAEHKAKTVPVAPTAEAPVEVVHGRPSRHAAE